MTLKSLDLYCNDIGPKGGVLLSRSLRRNTTLTSLNLNMNNIGNGLPSLIGNCPRASHPDVGLPDRDLEHTKGGATTMTLFWKIFNEETLNGARNQRVDATRPRISKTSLNPD
jgi:hypothetical protein